MHGRPKPEHTTTMDEKQIQGTICIVELFNIIERITGLEQQKSVVDDEIDHLLIQKEKALAQNDLTKVSKLTTQLTDLNFKQVEIEGLYGILLLFLHSFRIAFVRNLAVEKSRKNNYQYNRWNSVLDGV